MSTVTKRGMPLTAVMGSWRIRSRPRNDPEEAEEAEEAVVGCTYASPGFGAAARSTLPTFRVSGELKRPITLGGALNYKAHILKSQEHSAFIKEMCFGSMPPTC